MSTAQNQPRQTVVFIGDSLTYGMTDGGRAPLNAVQIAGGALGLENYRVIDDGHNGATTGDWIEPDKEYLADALTDVDNSGATTVMIMLGTNDAPATSAAKYKSNLKTLIGDLKSAGVQKIVLNQPPWTACGKKCQTKNQRLVDYDKVLSDLAKNDSQVYSGFAAYNLTKDKPNLFISDGIHMTEAGYNVLGEGWAAAVKAATANLSRAAASNSQRQIPLWWAVVGVVVAFLLGILFGGRGRRRV